MSQQPTMPCWSTMVSIGDSFSEGVGDHSPHSPNEYLGWCDRFAAELSRSNSQLQYANLAVRGKLLGQVLEEQLEQAVSLNADLYTVYAGGNDYLRPKVDFDYISRTYSEIITTLKSTGADVLMVTSHDPGWAPVFRRLRGRTAIYNEIVREIADNHGALIADFWRMNDFQDARLWDWDRMHLSSLGHHRMATNILTELNIPHTLRNIELAPQEPPTRQERRKLDVQWTAGFVLPWISRRVRGVSSGDTVSAKYPDYIPAKHVAELVRSMGTPSVASHQFNA